MTEKGECKKDRRTNDVSVPELATPVKTRALYYRFSYNSCLHL